MTIFLIFLIVVSAIAAIFGITKLQKWLKVFDSLMMTFVSSNQRFYEFQHKAKSKDLELNIAIANNLKELITQVSQLNKYNDQFYATLNELSNAIVKVSKIKCDDKKLKELADDMNRYVKKHA